MNLWFCRLSFRLYSKFISWCYLGDTEESFSSCKKLDWNGSVQPSRHHQRLLHVSLLLFNFNALTAIESPERFCQCFLWTAITQMLKPIVCLENSWLCPMYISITWSDWLLLVSRLSSVSLVSLWRLPNVLGLCLIVNKQFVYTLSRYERIFLFCSFGQIDFAIREIGNRFWAPYFFNETERSTICLPEQFQSPRGLHLSLVFWLPLPKLIFLSKKIIQASYFSDKTIISKI